MASKPKQIGTIYNYSNNSDGEQNNNNNNIYILQWYAT